MDIFVLVLFIVAELLVILSPRVVQDPLAGGLVEVVQDCCVSFDGITVVEPARIDREDELRARKLVLDILLLVLQVYNPYLDVDLVLNFIFSMRAVGRDGILQVLVHSHDLHALRFAPFGFHKGVQGLLD